MGEAALSLRFATSLVLIIRKRWVLVIMVLQETRAVIPMSVILSHVKHSCEATSLHWREVGGAGEAILCFALVLGDCATATAAVLMIFSIHLLCFLF